jgi:inosine-uridine nucleoside N-ribohydrolase
MAFNDWPAGGDAFNVVNDPVAWQVVLNSDVPLVVGGAAVTRGGLALTRSEAAAQVSSRGPVGDYLHSLFVEWLDRQAALVAQLVAPDTWVIWDEVVVAYVLGMARGEEVSRPGLNADLSFSHQETERRMTWITSIDSDRVWRDFTSGWMGTRSGTLLRRRLRAKVPVSSSVDERTACCLTVV